MLVTVPRPGTPPVRRAVRFTWRPDRRPTAATTSGFSSGALLFVGATRPWAAILLLRSLLHGEGVHGLGSSALDERFLASGDQAGTAPGDRRFRPDVEGLRAVAVLLVVFYHAGFPRVTGGFIGVDVFFVISGFVITGLLAARTIRQPTAPRSCRFLRPTNVAGSFPPPRLTILVDGRRLTYALAWIR